jgi:hypothetical protein
MYYFDAKFNEIGTIKAEDIPNRLTMKLPTNLSGPKPKILLN